MSASQHSWTILHRTDWGHEHDSLLDPRAPVPEQDECLRVIDVVPAEQLASQEAEIAHLRKSIANSDRDHWFEETARLAEQLQGAVEALKAFVEAAAGPIGRLRLEGHPDGDVLYDAVKLARAALGQSVKEPEVGDPQ